MRDMDGNEIKVGDYVGFKNGIEQSGKVVRFDRGMVVLSCWDSDAGEHFEQSVSPNRCWHE